MLLMVDNYDSFVYNLATYFKENGEEVEVIRNDDIVIKQLEERIINKEIEGIIISPGPKGPWDCGESAEIVKRFAGQIPILGVCLGHQIIGYVFGANVDKGRIPMHGKVTKIQCNNKKGVFRGLPQEFMVTRYHSLIIESDKLPKNLKVEAYDSENNIMAISHKRYPVYGVQFHPEAVLTEYGHELLNNFAAICREWKEVNHEKSY